MSCKKRSDGEALLDRSERALIHFRRNIFILDIMSLWLNQGECLKINYTSIEKWRWASTHRPRKASFAECVNAKALRSHHTQCKSQAPLGTEQRRKRADDTGKIFVHCKYKPISTGLNYLLGSDNKILIRLKLFHEEREKNNPSSPHWVCCICPTCSCKGWREGGKEGRREWQLFLLCPKGKDNVHGEAKGIVSKLSPPLSHCILFLCCIFLHGAHLYWT